MAESKGACGDPQEMLMSLGGKETVPKVLLSLLAFPLLTTVPKQMRVSEPHMSGSRFTGRKLTEGQFSVSFSLLSYSLLSRYCTRILQSCTENLIGIVQKATQLRRQIHGT